MKRITIAIAALLFASCDIEQSQKIEYAYVDVAQEYESAASTARSVAISHIRQDRVYDSLIRIANRYDSLHDAYMLKADSIRLRKAQEKLDRLEGRTVELVESLK